MNPKLKMALSILSMITTLGTGTGTVYASDSATPGDLLFGVDTAVESVQRALTNDPVAKTELELEIMDERLEELAVLAEENKEDGIATALEEIESQQARLGERVQEMNQLRTENKLQTSSQEQVMVKLQAQVESHQEQMNQVNIQLNSSGNGQNSDNLQNIQNSYSEKTMEQIRNFEEETGLQIQNQQQNQNSPTDNQQGGNGKGQ